MKRPSHSKNPAVPRCRWCRKTEGELRPVHVERPALRNSSSGFGYRASKVVTRYEHPACLEVEIEFNRQSAEQADRERAELIEKLEAEVQL
jgi:hypothetical protein